jgi:hypothetical protein
MHRRAATIAITPACKRHPSGMNGRRVVEGKLLRGGDEHDRAWSARSSVIDQGGEGRPLMTTVNSSAS